MPAAGCWCTNRWPRSSSTTWSREVGSLIVGEPGAGDDVEIGPLVSKAHFDRVSGFLDRARAEGIHAARRRVAAGPDPATSSHRPC